MNDTARVRGVRAGNVVAIDRTEPFDRNCELCGQLNDCRPYGPKGEWVCFSCGMKDEKAAERQFERLVLRRTIQ